MGRVMKTETHILNELHATRYVPDSAEYALVISHGLGGYGGIYDVFCEHHAAKGVDIWSYDAPGHGRSTMNRARGTWTMDEWAQASRDWAAHVKQKTGLPVFLLGSSLGAAAAISAIDEDAVDGVIIMGSAAVPGSALVRAATEDWRNPAVNNIIESLGRAVRLDIDIMFNFDEDYGYKGASEQKKSDPLNTWSYDLASWASFLQYDPPQPLSDNTKPVLFTAGTDDPNFPPGTVEAIAGEVGGPVSVEIFDGAHHQLMLFETEKFSTCADQFCRTNIQSTES